MNLARQAALLGSAISILAAGGLSARAQSGEVLTSDAKRWTGFKGPDRNAASAALGGVECLSHCVYCWIGTPYEQDCDPQWLDDDGCDCGCQFADNFDCGSNCSCPTACVWCWCNTTAQGACDPSWNGDGECDCACQFADVDCPGATLTGACCATNGGCSVTTSSACSSSGGTYRGNGVACAQANCSAATGACCAANGGCTVGTAAACASSNGAYMGNSTSCGTVNCSARCQPGCEACWVGTPRAGACDPDWEGDSVCDCGCQFTDPDCGPRGACCAPVNGLCVSLTETTCRFYYAGVFRGVGVGCGQVDCHRCEPGCEWCWLDTVAEHDCLESWNGDLECDCGCQFADPDCAGGVCGNLVCEETATTCSLDCMDLRSVAEFQNCFRPGVTPPPSCIPYIYAPPAGIGPEDYARFFDLLSPP